MPRKWSTLLCGLILSVLPAAAFAQYYYLDESADRIRLPATALISSIEHRLVLNTELHDLRRSEMSGASDVSVGQPVFVHLAKGPEKLAYPFAITHDYVPGRLSGSDFVLKGLVTDATPDRISLRFAFDTIPLDGAIGQALENPGSAIEWAEIAADGHGKGLLLAVGINGERIPHHRIENPALSLFMKNGASAAPAR